MDRSEFLKVTIGAGVCCGAAALLGGSRVASAAAAAAAPRLTPFDERVKQGQGVLRRLMAQLDATFPPEVRERFMAGCGRACFESTSGPRKGAPTAEQARQFVEKIAKRVGADNVREAGGETLVHLEFAENQRGPRTADPYCLCAIMEDAPKDISPTYCACSVGHLQELFERSTGQPTRVTLLESVLRGGKRCAFEIRFRLAA